MSHHYESSEYLRSMFVTFRTRRHDIIIFLDFKFSSPENLYLCLLSEKFVDSL